ncbi:serine/threonine protein phosphatase 1 [Chitinophaga niastensis]|uniref:Serine/threonine protein phosphatase 1 n=1 Tax=Chitinophaga niastensis TaxID=536980 RepID=A0A2P8HNS0_CHINA|nr:metallophosphoesterase [Chitinophaga niastensis]PSL47851.1 serine/threonine protein phosphatase 1 [Chitinophaga niastensis]
MSATYVIGDIHGALKALQQLIKRIAPAKEDTFIFLGDYVDGWSESAGVVAYLMELEQQHRCIFMKGNHDAWCELWLKGISPGELWLKQGGSATVKSYEALSKEQKQVHLAFYNRLLNFYEDGQQRLFIHGGFTSLRGPANDRYEGSWYWDRTLWELALATDKRLHKNSVYYPERLLLYEEIFIGHTPTIFYNEFMPMKAMNVNNIDTGAAYTGKISAMNINTKKVWQSDTVQSLYPNEKGRNI